MVAYNFRARFADAAASGEKCQTIRPPRKSNRHTSDSAKASLTCANKTYWRSLHNGN